MNYNLRDQLAAFVREQRGAATYGEFAAKTGVASSTLDRMEKARNETQLRNIIQLANGLDLHLKDIFPQLCAGCCGHSKAEPRR